MATPQFDKDGNLSNLDELTPQEVATAYQEKNKSLFGRLTDEETKRKQVEADKAKLESDLEEEKKKSAKPPEDDKPKPEGVSPDELRLLAKGLSDEEIEEAKSIAKGKGITLAEALKTKTFQLYQADLKEEQKREKAKLGASQGSDQVDPELQVKPGMTKEEHQKVWKKALGK